MYKPFFDRDVLLNSSMFTESTTWEAPENIFEFAKLDFSKDATTTTFSAKPDAGPLFMDDHGNTAATAGTVNLSGTTSGIFEAAGDADWFSVTVAEGETITVINMDPSLDLRLMNGDGTVADTGTFFIDGEVYDDLAAGTYYLEAAENTGAAPHNYNLTVRTHLDDHGDEAATASTLGSGGVIETQVDPDWFEISIAAGETFQIGYMFGGMVNIGLRDINGNAIASSDSINSGPETYESWDTLSAGTYYVVAEGGPGIPTGATASYGFGGSTYVDDHRGDSSTTSVLPTSGVISGSLQGPTDADWFETALANGETLNIQTTGLGADQSVRVYDAAGTSQGGSFNGGDGSFTFTASASGAGTYYVGVENVPGGFGPVANANYTLSTLPEDDFAGNATTTGNLDLSNYTSARVEYIGDIDWFKVTIDEGETFRIDQPSVFRPHNPNLQFRLVNADGTEVAIGENFTSSSGQGLIFDDLSAGTYYLEVESVGPSATTAYTIHDATFTDDHGDEAETATNIGTGITLSGRLHFSVDEDWFALDVADGENIDFSSSIFGDLTNTLYQADGTVVDFFVSYGLSGRDITSYQNLDAGTYYYSVSGTSRSGGQTFSADLNRFIDDHGNDIDTNSFLPSEGVISGSLEGVSDTDWF